MDRYTVRTTTILGTSVHTMTGAEVNRYISAWSDSLGVLRAVGQSHNLADDFPRVRIEVQRAAE